MIKAVETRDAEKTFDKIHHHFMIKILNKLGNIRELPKPDIGHLRNPLSKLASNLMVTDRMVPPKDQRQDMICALTTSIQHCNMVLEVLIRTRKQENEIKGIHL